MNTKDTRDILGGGLLTLLGLFAAWYAQRYEFGELTRMGPGYFPTALGLVLAVLGLLIAVPALKRPGDPIVIQWKTFALIMASLLAFAFTLKVVGLVLATVLAVIISSLADNEITWRTRILAAAGVAAITWAVFSLGLSMILPVWPWSL